MFRLAPKNITCVSGSIRRVRPWRTWPFPCSRSSAGLIVFHNHLRVTVIANPLSYQGLFMQLSASAIQAVGHRLLLAVHDKNCSRL